MVARNLMGHGHSLFQCLGARELCRVLPFLTATLEHQVGWEPSLLRGEALSRAAEWQWLQQPALGKYKWRAPPKPVLTQTVLHLDAVSSFGIWELSCLIKRKGKTKTGDGELLWEQRHPWQRWSQHHHKHSPREFWACKGLKLIPPWGSSLHVYLTTQKCYYASQNQSPRLFLSHAGW